METITRNVSDLAAPERSALESVVGHPLRETERIIVSVQKLELPGFGTSEPKALPDGIPDYWRIYEGMSDEEVEDVSSAIVRCNTSRSFE